MGSSYWREGMVEADRGKVIGNERVGEGMRKGERE